MRKVLIGILGLAGVVAILLAGQSTIKAADHNDPPSLAGMNTDIGDLYAWSQGDNLNMVMTFGTGTFSSDLQYVFHVESGPAYGMTMAETTILCQFDAAGAISCWVGDQDGGEDFTSFVTGDASDPAGITSDAGDLTVFAGTRNDPFFFNLDGFRQVVTTVHAVAGGLVFNENSCPDLDVATAGALVGQLAQDDDGDGNLGGPPATDDFALANAEALVVSVNKNLVNANGDILAVWSSVRR